MDKEKNGVSNDGGVFQWSKQAREAPGESWGCLITSYTVLVSCYQIDRGCREKG